ncbi:MAG: HypC/HybG/HupF family hydrogenase formation chaperone [Oligoflexus sp.]
MCLAIPGEVISIDHEIPSMPIAIVQFGTICRKVNLAFVPEAKIGDFILTHVGFAIARIDTQSADHLFKFLEDGSKELGHEISI